MSIQLDTFACVAIDSDITILSWLVLLLSRCCNQAVSLAVRVCLLSPCYLVLSP